MGLTASVCTGTGNMHSAHGPLYYLHHLRNLTTFTCRVYYVSERIMKLACNVARENIVSMGVNKSIYSDMTTTVNTTQ